MGQSLHLLDTARGTCHWPVLKLSNIDQSSSVPEQSHLIPLPWMLLDGAIRRGPITATPFPQQTLLASNFIATHFKFKEIQIQEKKKPRLVECIGALPQKKSSKSKNGKFRFVGKSCVGGGYIFRKMIETS